MVRMGAVKWPSCLAGASMIIGSRSSKPSISLALANAVEKAVPMADQGTLGQLL